MKILFTGASGVGKTTLVDKFLSEYNNFYKPDNFIRTMHNYFNFSLNEETSYEFQYAVTAFMSHQIITNEFMISDRSLVDYMIWSKMAKNISKKQYKKIKKDFIKLLKDKEIIHFYIPIEFDLEQDKFRSKDKKYRDEIDKNIKKFLDKNKISYVTLTGDIENRYNKMIKTINYIEADRVF